MYTFSPHSLANAENIVAALDLAVSQLDLDCGGCRICPQFSLEQWRICFSCMCVRLRVEWGPRSTRTRLCASNTVFMLKFSAVVAKQMAAISMPCVCTTDKFPQLRYIGLVFASNGVVSCGRWLRRGATKQVGTYTDPRTAFEVAF